jgi:hypothetical protein
MWLNGEAFVVVDDVPDGTVVATAVEVARSGSIVATGVAVRQAPLIIIVMNKTIRLIGFVVKLLFGFLSGLPVLLTS